MFLVSNSLLFMTFATPSILTKVACLLTQNTIIPYPRGDKNRNTFGCAFKKCIRHQLQCVKKLLVSTAKKLASTVQISAYDRSKIKCRFCCPTTTLKHPVVLHFKRPRGLLVKICDPNYIIFATTFTVSSHKKQYKRKKQIMVLANCSSATIWQKVQRSNKGLFVQMTIGPDQGCAT